MGALSTLTIAKLHYGTVYLREILFETIAPQSPKVAWFDCTEQSELVFKS